MQYISAVQNAQCTPLLYFAVFCKGYVLLVSFNTLRPRQHGRHFADDTFKRIFLNENVIIAINISLKFVPKGPINNIPALVQIMAWRRSGDKPLSEPMVVSLLTHICVTRPQWVKVNLLVLGESHDCSSTVEIIRKPWAYFMGYTVYHVYLRYQNNVYDEALWFDMLYNKVELFHF